MFLVLLFFIKNKSIFENSFDFTQNKEAGLIYDNTTVANLVNKDTDLDGVLDWEEGLWGTDPMKAETTEGIPDSLAIERLKVQQIAENGGQNSSLSGNGNEGTENLTETDKFSREFFSTVATLNQNGTMDQETMDKLGVSLAEKIQNSVPRKVFTILDIKIIKDDSVKAVKNYNDSFDSIFKKYPAKESAVNVLQKFAPDEDTVDSSVLSELDPIIKQTQNIINELTKINVPESLALSHLDFINGMERLAENLSDIQFYDTDVIVALSAIGQYEKNVTLLESATENLGNMIQQKLNN
ncbi:MAG: hypothetical protein WC884_03165 [Candidatus Paceibacterota bacterium]